MHFFYLIRNKEHAWDSRQVRQDCAQAFEGTLFRGGVSPKNPPFRGLHTLPGVMVESQLTVCRRGHEDKLFERPVEWDNG